MNLLCQAQHHRVNLIHFIPSATSSTWIFLRNREVFMGLCDRCVLLWDIKNATITDLVNALYGFNTWYRFLLLPCTVTLILTAINKNSPYRTIQLVTSSCLIILFSSHMWLIKQLWLNALPNLEIIKYLAVNYTLKCLLIFGTTLYFMLIRRWVQNIGNIIYIFFLSTSIYIAYHFYLKVSTAQETQSDMTNKLIESEENLIIYQDVPENIHEEIRDDDVTIEVNY